MGAVASWESASLPGSIRDGGFRVWVTKGGDKRVETASVAEARLSARRVGTTVAMSEAPADYTRSPCRRVITQIVLSGVGG